MAISEDKSKRFDERYDRMLPVDVRFGLSKQLADVPLRLSVTAWNLTNGICLIMMPATALPPVKWRRKIRSAPICSAIWCSVWSGCPSDRLYIGVGYNYKTRYRHGHIFRSFFSGFSACAGINVKQIFSRNSFGSASYRSYHIHAQPVDASVGIPRSLFNNKCCRQGIRNKR